MHLSTAEGLACVREAQKAGQPVIAETCPQYLLLDESAYAERDGLKYIMAPPLRTEADRAALWEGLADGSISVAATDHCSFSLAQKRERGKESVLDCPGGVPGVETRIPLLFSEGVLHGRLTLPRFVDVVSTSPARLMGLASKGRLEPGADADIVVICAGVSQKPGESRLDLLKRNTAVFQSIIGPITHSGFSGIFLVATNPVDIMTRVTYELSGFNSNRVFGTGTTLDTARLRYLLGDYFTVDPRNVHAYVIGEHGDSEFVPWSQAMVATKSVADICEQSQGKFCLEGMQTISVEVRDAAQKIIEAKRATYYGIGMALVRIVRAVLSNENSVLTVSARLRGEYGQRDVFAGVPCIVNRNGVDRVLELSLTEEERQKLADSCAILQENYQGLEL